MKILVTGSCGYIGARLMPELQNATGMDKLFFGGEPDLVGDFTRAVLPKHDVLIHLAGLTSDAACQLNPQFAQQMNVDGMKNLVNRSIMAGAHRFIFISSAAAYGSTETPAVETDPLKPTTLYAAAKAKCEDVLRKFENDIECVVLRPSAACGYSPRMRFDLTVNQMTRDACMTGNINVHGGEQKRPNIHILDFVDCIRWALTGPVGTFNLSAETSTVKSVAQRVKKIVEKEKGKEIAIVTTPRSDNRSYGVNTLKLSQAGFMPRFQVEDAIKDMTHRFMSNEWKNPYDEIYSNVYRPV